MHQGFEERARNRLVRKALDHLARELYRKHEDVMEANMLVLVYCTRPWKYCSDLSTVVLEVPDLSSEGEHTGSEQ